MNCMCTKKTACMIAGTILSICMIVSVALLAVGGWAWNEQALMRPDEDFVNLGDVCNITKLEYLGKSQDTISENDHHIFTCEYRFRYVFDYNGATYNADEVQYRVCMHCGCKNVEDPKLPYNQYDNTHHVGEDTECWKISDDFHTQEDLPEGYHCNNEQCVRITDPVIDKDGDLLLAIVMFAIGGFLFCPGCIGLGLIYHGCRMKAPVSEEQGPPELDRGWSGNWYQPPNMGLPDQRVNV